MPQFVCCDCGEKPGCKGTEISQLHEAFALDAIGMRPLSRQLHQRSDRTRLQLHTNHAHPGKQVQCMFFPDSQKHQLLKHKVRLSKISIMERNNPTVISINPTLTKVASQKRKPEVIVIDDEEESKPASAPVVAKLSGQVQTARRESTNYFTHATHQSLSVGENTGSIDNHLAANSTLCQWSKPPGVESENKQLSEAPQPVNGPVEECNVLPKIYESDEDGDDFEPESPPSSTTESKQPEVGRQSHLSSSTTAEERRAKLEVMAGDDVDDDFVPFPPSPNTRSQQPDVGHSAPNRGVLHVNGPPPLRPS